MIADVKDIILKNEDHYMTLSSDEIYSLNNDTHLVKDSHPMWNLDISSCELACLHKNISLILSLCNFHKVGVTNEIQLTKTPHNRVLYLERLTPIELDCPSEKIRDNLIGLHLIPSECDLITPTVQWPARQLQHIEIKALIEASSRGKSFDITYLPTFELNESTNLHDTIKEQIDKLPSENPFTFDFAVFMFVQRLFSKL